MYFLPLTKKQTTHRKELGEEMWSLCQLACPKIYKDMQRVSLMKAFDRDYFKEEFPKISKDFAIISVFGMQLDKPDEFDWKSLKDRWAKLRNIVAKYIDNTHSTKFALIDHQCGFILRRLPEINHDDPPRKPLPREWWDNHPDREGSLENIALNWWLMDSLPPHKYEDFAEEELVEDVQDDPFVVDQGKEMAHPGRPGCAEGRLIEVE